jgi:transglutaminase-like putative cysteine protease
VRARAGRGAGAGADARAGAIAPPGRDRLFWTTGVVAGATVPHWSHLPFWIPVLLAVAIAWRFAEHLHGWRLPRAVLRLALAMLAFAGVLAEYGTVNGIEPGTALLVVMVALKLLESRSRRDELVLIIICYFLVFASLLYDQSLLVAAYLLGFVWVTTVGLLQLGRGGRLLSPRLFAGLAGRMLLQALPIAIVLFLLFPRLPGPLWGIPGPTDSTTTGLSDTMSPGDITTLAVSDEVAFRVEFFGPPPPADRLYWRGPVLSRFDGRKWSRPDGLFGRRPEDTIEYSGEPTRYRVMLEPHDRRWLLALDMPVQWASVRPLRLGGDYGLRLGFGPPPPTRLDYEVTSYTNYFAREPLNETQRRWYTFLPEGSNPRTRALTESWRESASDPAALVERALDFFRSREFFYTLTPPALGTQATDEFLFETRRGFCEHYASALAVMMRSAGVLARVVSGYQGGELNAVGDYYIVRQRDAHAWTEVWLGDRGWVRIDPVAAVAPARIEQGSARGALNRTDAARVFGRIGWMHRAALVWDAVDTYWNDWVVGYGPKLQTQLVRALGVADPSAAKLAVLAAGAMLLLLGALGAYLSWSQRGGRRPDPAVRDFARLVRKLARVGVAPRAPSETAAAYAARAAASVPAASASIYEILQAYHAARYGPDADGAAEVRLRSLVAALRASSVDRPRRSELRRRGGGG